VVQATDNLLSKGIYTPRQAAWYARLRTEVLARWIHGDQLYKPVLRAELVDDPDRLVTFIDLIQALAIRSIRLSKTDTGKSGRNVPLQKIRKVVEKAESQGLPFPFAREHRTYLFDDEIVVHLLKEDELVCLTGKYRNQHLIRPVVELYAEDLTFEGWDYTANRYTPYHYRGRTVVIDPAVRFGQAFIDPSGYTVEALVTAFETEGSTDAAARAYGVDEDDIRAAQRYTDWLLGVAG